LANDLLSLHTPVKKKYMPSPNKSSDPSKETGLYRAAIKTADTSASAQYVIIADCAGVDAEGGVLRGPKLDEWLKKKYVSVFLFSSLT